MPADTEIVKAHKAIFGNAYYTAYIVPLEEHLWKKVRPLSLCSFCFQSMGEKATYERESISRERLCSLHLLPSNLVFCSTDPNVRCKAVSNDQRMLHGY